jgi:hypothetical protein
MRKSPLATCLVVLALAGCERPAAITPESSNTPPPTAAPANPPATSAPAASASSNAPPSPAASSALSVTDVSSAPLPAGITVPGKLLEARRWQDARGTELLLISREGPIAEKEADEKGAKLYAFQYTQKGASWELAWKLFDEERECPFDLLLAPLPASTSITDLDGDGTAEVTLVYEKTCRSDVSPAEMKVILREGGDKYALRGTMCGMEAKGPAPEPCCAQKGQAEECKYESEKDFAAAPPAFLQHAKKTWVRFVKKDQFKQL